MIDIEFNRRLFKVVLWVFTGLMLLVLLTSCTPWDSFASLSVSTATSTPTPSPAATVTTATPAGSAGVTASPTPRLVFLVDSDALEVRNGPSESTSNIGFLKRGDLVIVYQTAQAEK